MSQDTSTHSSGGIGFSGLLTVAFIVLKLTHVIDWSWWWVLSPLWIGAGVALLILLALVITLSLVRKRKRKANA